MRAAILHEFGQPLSVEDVPAPTLGTGEVIVDVVAAGILPYLNEVLSGQRKYALTLPVAPGCGAVGRIRAVGPDATRLAVGDWVWCDPTIRSRDGVPDPDITLQGLSARGEGGLKLQKHFGQGPFAEQMLMPTENVFPLGPLDPVQARRWCAATVFLVPYGGLVAGGLRAGETVLVSGATGNFGGAAVAVALAMGAGRVIAPGRNEKALADLRTRFGSRVQIVAHASLEQLTEPIDLVIDLLPPSAGTDAVRRAAMTVRRGGRVVLMGGVGMLGGDDLALPYPWIMRNDITVRGKWMAAPEANPEFIKLAQSGLLDLDQVEITPFPLAEANAAVKHAAATGGRFKMTVLCP